MTWPIMRLPHLLALALGIVPAASAQARMPLFLDTCVAKAGDLARRPLAGAKAGRGAGDRAAGSPGPASAARRPDRRLWRRRAGPGWVRSLPAVARSATCRSQYAGRSAGPGYPRRTCWWS